METQESQVEKLARMIRHAWFVTAILIVASLLISFTPFLRDDTDTPSDARSQMSLYTDHGTGCQYLGRFWGTLTPRLNGSGKQMGCRP